MLSNDKLYQAAKTRFSTRKYVSDPDEREIEALRALADELSRADFRIAIGFDENIFDYVFKRYGSIHGVTCFAAFISKGASQLDVGYLGEKFILCCEAMGLGTCWLGASYDKKSAADFCKLEDGEKVVCLTPIGKGAASVGVRTRSRRAMDSLCGLTLDKFERLPLWQQTALQCARIAPSAINSQPWQFIVDTYSLTVKNTFFNFGYGLLDCGIAMLHIELGATACGMTGLWETGSKYARFVQMP